MTEVNGPRKARNWREVLWHLKTNEEIAAETGCHPTYVSMMRSAVARGSFPKKERRRSWWELVDWDRPDEEIAAETGKALSTVKRKRTDVRLSGAGLVEEGRIRGKVDWSKVDWVKRTNEEICRETGCCYTYVSMQRSRHAYGTAAAPAQQEILERWDEVFSARSCLEAARRLGMDATLLRNRLQAMGRVPGHWQHHERADVKIRANLSRVLEARDCAHAARICGVCPASVREWLDRWGLAPGHWRQNRGAEEVDAGIRARLDEVLASRSITEAARLAGCAPSILAGRLRRWGLAPMWEGKIGERLRALAGRKWLKSNRLCPPRLK